MLHQLNRPYTSVEQITSIERATSVKQTISVEQITSIEQTISVEHAGYQLDKLYMLNISYTWV